jgi:DedD protein
MDSKAKQRLTGAVILVALFVLLVPQLLDGPGEQESAPTTDESGLRRYTIDIDSPRSSVQPAQPSSPPEVKLPEVTHAAPTASTPSPEAGGQERAQPGEAATSTRSVPANPVATPAPATPAASPAASSAPAAAAVAPPPSSPPQRAVSGPAALPARTPMPSPASAPAQPRVPAGSFAVQLGTFENRDNANRLVQEMTAKGFAAFVAPFKREGRELYRVRVGPTRDRAAAEALAAQLKRVGHSGSVVAIS